MGRTPGALNKKNISVEINKTTPAARQENKLDNEDIFLAECLRAYTHWKGEATRLKAEGKESELEVDYAEAYRVLINKFTVIEK